MSRALAGALLMLSALAPWPLPSLDRAGDRPFRDLPPRRWSPGTEAAQRRKWRRRKGA